MIAESSVIVTNIKEVKGKNGYTTINTNVNTKFLEVLRRVENAISTVFPVEQTARDVKEPVL